MALRQVKLGKWIALALAAAWVGSFAFGLHPPYQVEVVRHCAIYILGSIGVWNVIAEWSGEGAAGQSDHEDG